MTTEAMGHDGAGDGREQAEPLNGPQTLARSLHQFLNLGVAQLDAAVRESDAQVDKIAACLASISAEVQRFEARLPPGDADANGAELVNSVRASVQSVVKALQFYDKLVQRLTHVRSGLAIPADATADMALAAKVDWNNVLDQVRARYSMVEERVLFDFMMRGLRAEQMLKALQSLREASAPGELELF
ncbi:MAG: hypothetical protein WB646_03065 [Steroidobacteraceae bacterium]